MSTPDSRLRTKLMMACPPKPDNYKPVPRGKEFERPTKPMPIAEKAALERFTSVQRQQMTEFIKNQHSPPTFSKGYVNEWINYWVEYRAWKERVIAWQHAVWAIEWTENAMKEYKLRRVKNGG